MRRAFVPARLRAALGWRNCGAAEAAQAAGLDPARVRALASGQATPTTEEIEALAQALEVPAQALSEPAGEGAP